MKRVIKKKDAMSEKFVEVQGPNPWGKRLLQRFRLVSGVRYQLHATKGWRKG